MGYYTGYKLTTSEEYDLHYKQIGIESGYSNPFEDTIKWYEHESDMRSYSKKYPDVLFTLNGEGEESGDIWIEYYKNGLMQRTKAKLMFDKFYPSKLS